MRSQGGLKEGLLVELSNGGMALVVKADEETVVLDANNMVSWLKGACKGVRLRWLGDVDAPQPPCSAACGEVAVV